ncbi:MAG: DoxX family protein, partial [Chitinophagaceae bacterium]
MALKDLRPHFVKSTNQERYPVSVKIRAAVILTKKFMSQKETKTDWRVESLRLSFGVLMLWFGILKVLDPAGPAESLAERTVDFITAGMIRSNTAVYAIAILEICIGIGILIQKALRYVMPVLFLHMAGT